MLVHVRRPGASRHSLHNTCFPVQYGARSWPIGPRDDDRRASGGADFCLLPGVDRVTVFRGRESSLTHVAGITLERASDLGVEIRITTDEARPNLAHECTEDVVRDHQLPVDVRSSADTVDENIDSLADVGSRLSRHRLEQKCEDARFLE